MASNFDKMRTLGSLAALTVAGNVIKDARAKGPGGELYKGIIDAAAKEAETPGYLVGFCEELERYIAGWVTGDNPITTPTSHKYVEIDVVTGEEVKDPTKH